MKYPSHVLNNKCRPRDSLLLPNRIGKKKEKKEQKKSKKKSKSKSKSKTKSNSKSKSKY